jgi:hypothetical protein
MLTTVMLSLILATVSAAPPASFDVLVYDATSGGVMAAVAAARHGATTALLCASWPACFPEGGHVLGGMSAGGLGQTDLGSHPEIIGGFAAEFYERNRKVYGGEAEQHQSALLPQEEGQARSNPGCRLPAAGCNATYNLEPHVAQRIFTEMLDEAGVKVFFAAQVEHVAKEGTAVSEITLTDGASYRAKVFIGAGRAPNQSMSPSSLFTPLVSLCSKRYR